LKGLVLLSAFNNFFSVPILLLLPFYVEDYLKVKVDWYGFLLAAFGIGSLLGFGVAGVTRFSGRTRARIMMLVMIVDAVLYGLLALVRQPLAALALAMLSGAAGGFFVVNTTTIIQLTTPSQIRGRIFGLLGTIAGSITPLAMGLSGVIADLTGKNIPLIYLTCSGALLILALVIMSRREIRKFLAYERPTGENQELS
jgi:MFS family permease